MSVRLWVLLAVPSLLALMAQAKKFPKVAPSDNDGFEKEKVCDLC